MRFQRIFGLAVMVLPAIAFAMTSQGVTLPVVLSAVAAIGASGRIAIKMPVRPFLAGLFLALLFFVIGRNSPFDDSDVRTFAAYAEAYSMGQFMLTWMALQFIIRQEDGLPPTLPLYAVGVMICAGDVLLGSTQQRQYQIIAVALAAASAAFFASSRRPCVAAVTRRESGAKAIILLLIFAVCLTASWIGINQMRNHEQDLNLIFEQIIRMRSQITDIDFGSDREIGLSNDAQLEGINRIKKSSSPEVMLRVFSDSPPGYLRAMVYDTYDLSKWKTVATSWNASPAAEDAGQTARMGNLFLLDKAGDIQNCQQLDIWTSPKAAGPMFAPLGAVAVRLAAETLSINEHQAASSAVLAAALSYHALVPQATAPPLDGPALTEPAGLTKSSLETQCLHVPQGLDGRIVTLADEVFAGCSDSASRIAAVVRYFHNNYRYSLEFTAPRGRDPLTHFLLERPAAHCEFFATGAALLLRLGNVPTRYVTGFVADTRNGAGDYYLATSNDAHAWVEAWIGDAAGSSGHWVTVEATPADGVPVASRQGSLASLWDFLRFRLLQLRVAIEVDGFKGFAFWLWQQLQGLIVLLITTPGGLAVLAVTAALAFWRYLGPRLRRYKKRPSREIRELHRLLARLDRRAKRIGLTREDAETIHQFAARIRARAIPDTVLADKYILYATARYGQRH